MGGWVGRWCWVASSAGASYYFGRYCIKREQISGRLHFCYAVTTWQLLFQTKDGPIFFIVTLVYTCHAFFAVSSENICPIYCFGDSSSQSVSQWNSFSPLKYIVYKCFSCCRPVMGQFFHCHTCLHLSRFFCCIIRKYLSYILFWSQLVSVCFAMKFFSSFKIHCLQMFQSFQTRDGPIFFIVTLVYTCHAFFAASSENICPICIWLHHQDFWRENFSI